MTTAARKYLTPPDWVYQCWSAEVEAELSTNGLGWLDSCSKYDPITCREWFKKCFARRYSPQQASIIIERALKIYQEKFQKLFVAG